MTFVLWLTLTGSPPAGASELPPVSAAPEDRAVAWLSREVPLWRTENKCFSCHNNGDAARALFLAAWLRGEKRDPGKSDPDARSVRVTDAAPRNEPAVLADTLDWLAHPDRWQDNGGDGPFNDRVLADIQFGAALAAAVETGKVADRDALLRAARRVAGHQRDDGSWNVVPEGTLGSPVTYGPVLATALCHGVLVDARGPQWKEAVTRAKLWLAQRDPQTVLDAAALLAAPRYHAAEEQRASCTKLLQNGQSENGGWGPYVTSPPQVFDTALALIALARLRQRAEGRAAAELDESIRRGRDYQLATHHADGAWPETTRPTGGDSYAQRVSTTGWATIALLMTATRSE